MKTITIFLGLLVLTGCQITGYRSLSADVTETAICAEVYGRGTSTCPGTLVPDTKPATLITPR